MSAASESKQPPRPILFSGVRLIDPASRRDEIGDLLVVDGRIAATGGGLSNKGLPEATEHVAARGLCLAPGIVDLRVQLREPGEEHKETIASASTAAAAGGVTSMVALPNTDPVIDDVAGIEFIARRAREIRKVKVYVYAGVTKGLVGKDLTEFGLLSESGAVAFTDGLAAVADARVMRRALSYASAFGVLIVQHPEEPSLAAGGQMNEGELATRLGLAGIPAMAEVILIERDLRLLALVPHEVHVPHVPDQHRLVLGPPAHDRREFLNARAPILDGDNGPVTHQGIVYPEKLSAPPDGFAEGMVSDPAELHHRKH